MKKIKEEETIKPPTPPPKIVEKSKILPNPIDEYFKEQETNMKMFSSRELFTAKEEEIDLKTDLSIEEIKYINTLMVNDAFLISRGLLPIFSMYYKKYLRLKVSKDRLSRGEFVKINSDKSPEDLLQTANNLQNLSGGIKKWIKNKQKDFTNKQENINYEKNK